MTKTIEQRLDIYGPSICVCGNYKETVFFGRYQLTCRNHPGHPLYDGAGTPGLGGPLDLAADTIEVSGPVYTGVHRT